MNDEVIESPDGHSGGIVESDMECDSGTEAGEDELEVINVAESSTAPIEPENDHRPTAL